MDVKANMNGTYFLIHQSQIISDVGREILMVVNYSIIIALIGLFGLVTNAMNIVVFIKQGFNCTMNITLLGLAVSDICNLLTLLWGGVCVNPLFIKSDLDVEPLEIVHLTSGIPHICFVRITGWITVFITAERSLCVTLPLKVKQIVTPRVTLVTVLFIYMSNMLSFVPEYEMMYYDWKFVPARNRSLIGLVFRSNANSNAGVVFILYSVLGTVSFVAVIVLTLILVIQLQQKTKWRERVSGDDKRSEIISNRDKNSMKMVVLIATVLIVCYTPGVLVSMGTFFDHEFSITGSRVNLFCILWTFVFIFEALNSSVNIFLYFKMSSKFRETFKEKFGIFFAGSK